MGIIIEHSKKSQKVGILIQKHFQNCQQQIIQKKYPLKYKKFKNSYMEQNSKKFGQKTHPNMNIIS